MPPGQSSSSPVKRGRNRGSGLGQRRLTPHFSAPFLVSGFSDACPPGVGVGGFTWGFISRFQRTRGQSVFS